MKIGVIGALEEEALLFLNQIQQKSVRTIAHLTFQSGMLGNHAIVLVRSGIGKVNTSIASTLLIQEFGCEAIINLGVAGGLHPDLSVGDLVVASQLCYYDVDATSFGYAYGQVPKMPLFYKADENLLSWVKQAADRLPNCWLNIGLIVSGDSFLSHEQQAYLLREQFPDAYAIEMEGCAMAQTCLQFQIPFLVVRAISDRVGETSQADYRESLQSVADRAAHLVWKMLLEDSEPVEAGEKAN